MNLNIEKIEFFRPRIDASVRYLKKIAKLQNSLIDTPTAYEIIQQTNCDMRRALIQLQLELVTEPTKIPVQRNTTLQLAKYLSSLLDCRHTSDFPNPIHFLDFLAKKIEQNNNRNTHDKFRRYDSVVFKDGLSDTTEGPTFNPFMPNTPTNIDEDSLINLDEDMVSFKNQNTTEIFTAYTKIFNHIMSVSDWSKHGTVNSFSFTSNTAINKLAQYANKFTSNQSLFLEYRPFLQLICRAEEFKQKTSTKRRFTHYLTHLNIGIGKEDYSLLAKSSLACDVPEQQVVEKADGRVCKKNYVEDDLFSDGN